MAWHEIFYKKQIFVVKSNNVMHLNVAKKTGLTPLKKERFLILSKMDICSSLKKAGFYPPHHFTLFLASFHEKRFKGNTECFDQNHGLTLLEKSNSGTLKKERFLAIVQKDFF